MNVPELLFELAKAADETHHLLLRIKTDHYADVTVLSQVTLLELENAIEATAAVLERFREMFPA